MKLKSLMILPMLFSVTAMASPAAFDARVFALRDYHEVQEVSMVEDVPTAQELASDLFDLSQSDQNVPSISGAIDWNSMYFIGQKIVEILKANASVVNIKRDAVSVVPAGLQSWQQLAGWNAPATKVFLFKVTNRLGMDVVNMRLKVSGNWGGNYMGRGQYLANVIVVPTAIQTAVAWNLDLWTENREPVNSGSMQAPRAGLGFDIRYKVSSLLTQLNGSQDYFVTGDGKIQEIR